MLIMFVVVATAIVAVSGWSGPRRNSLASFLVGFLSLSFGLKVISATESLPATAVTSAQADSAEATALPSPAAGDSPSTESELDLSTSMLHIPPGRPEWVEGLPVRDRAVHSTAVSSGPHQRLRDAVQALDQELQSAVSDYITEYLDSRAAATLIHYNLKEVKARLVKRENMYHEVIQVSFGPMHQWHALVEFDDAFRAELDEKWGRLDSARRLLQTGLSAVGVLALLGTFFGYFRLDTATKGFYTGRLQFATVAAILAIVAAGMVLSGRIPDLLLYVVH